MSSESYPLVRDEFILGYRNQTEWGWKIASAFFFGEVGAGLFFFSAFFDFILGMVIGWFMVTVCKPAPLFMHLGRPLRAWRAIMNLRNSWISRGLLSNASLTAFGFIHIVNQQYGILPESLSTVVFMLALAASFMVMIYLGFVMSYSSALSLWNSGLMPVISLTYGLMGGVTLLILLTHNSFLAGDPMTLAFLKKLEFVLVIACMVMIVSLLHGAAYGSGAGKKSVWLLLKGDYSQYFITFVVFIGIVLTALLIWFGPVSLAVLMTIAIAELVGDIGLKLLLFKAATYEPTLSHSRF